MPSVGYNIQRKLNIDERNELAVFPDITAHLLFHRGFRTRQSAEKFIEPSYDRDIHDPFLLKGTERSAERIIHAIKNKQKIAIYSDYDADGIPGATLFADFMDRVGYDNYVVYIPHRHNEGFGLNESAVRELAEKNVELIITIDCGIADVMPVDVANSLNVDVIVTDHHEPPSELPKAYAIVDHRQSDCNYPDKNLCGSGVAYKLIQAILKKNRFDVKEGHEKWLLDMVGLATLSDMVPLVGENRVFAHYGLKVLRKSPRKGLVRLLKKLNILQNQVSEDDIGFMITPRINAASRMGVPMDAFKLLSAKTDEEAEVLASHLDEINNERKGIVASLVKEVKKTIKERHFGNIPSVIVLGNPSWRPSLLGLAANTCAQEFDRPVFLWGRDGDNAIKGSCRSEGRTHVVELMRTVPSGIIHQFGGHHHSGGFEISNEQIHFLEKHLNDAVVRLGESDKKYSNTELMENNKENSATKIIDLELKLDDIDWNLQKEISKLAPFGTGNPKPIFIFKRIIPENIKLFGKAKEHVEITFKRSGNSTISAISFFGASNSWAKNIQAGKSIDLIGSIEKSFFRGRTELRLRIEDIRV